jgi:AcrR family transcriptional regulator
LLRTPERRELVSDRTRPRTRLDPEVRRGQIVDAAEQVFHGRDPREVTFEEIAEAAGVSRALVYNYFGDRGGLIAAIYLRSLRRLDTEIDRAIDPESSDAERLHTVVLCYLRFARESSIAWRLIGSTATMDHPDVLTARRERFDLLARNWGDTAESRIAARAVVGFLEAATLEWIETREVDIERIAELLYTILWSGLMTVGRDRARVPPARTATATVT